MERLAKAVIEANLLREQSRKDDGSYGLSIWDAANKAAEGVGFDEQGTMPVYLLLKDSTLEVLEWATKIDMDITKEGHTEHTWVKDQYGRYCSHCGRREYHNEALSKPTKTVRPERAIEKLQQQFPDIKGIQDGERWGAGRGSLHLGDAAEGGLIDGQPAASYYGPLPGWDTHTNPKLEAALNQLGYYTEWWDAGTLVAYSE